jgi:hypothetical protein
MSKASKKLEDFFGARRRICTLLSSQLLRSKGKERRMKLAVTMPLSNKDMTDIPTQFLNQFSVMEKVDSATNRSTIDVEFDSMGVRIFSTDVTVEPTVSIQGALLHKFAMVAEGSGDKREVSLDFLIYLPATPALREWEWETIHAEFFLEAVKAQGSLDLSGEADDEDNEEESVSGNPLDTAHGRAGAVVVIPPPAKSGPKQLAEFHAAQGQPEQHQHIEPPATTGRRKPGTSVN